MRTVVLAACIALAACGGGEHDDLRQWMQEATKDFKGKVPPLPQVKPFPVVGYEAHDLLDPFRPAKIEPEKKASGALQPDLNRRKEPLEAYPLESLKMIGTLRRGRMIHALIQADKTVHAVKIGNYMGQNFGIITDITEEPPVVTLRELVPDSLGDYTERTSTLQLQEKAGG